MLLIALLLLAAVAPASPDYPVPAILAAFDSACGAPGDPVANAAALEQLGWTRLGEKSRTPLSTMVDKALHGSYSLDSSTDYGAQFRKTVAGRTLYVLLSKTSYGGSMSGDEFECTLYDFKAPRAPSTDELSGWSVGRTLARTEAKPNGEVFSKYETEKDALLNFYFQFVPKAAGTDRFLTGLSLSAAAHKGSR